MYTQDNSIILREVLGKKVGAQIGNNKYFDFIKTENSCWPNALLNMNVSINEIEDFIELVTCGIQNETLPSVLVTKIGGQDSHVLMELKKRDFKVGHWTVMQHDLSLLDKKTTLGELKIKRVCCIEQLQHWMRICETELMKGKMDIGMFDSILEDKNILLFLGYVNETPVCTSLIFIDNEVSGLYFIATDEAHRKKGYGKEITQHALFEAKSRACKIMNLEATDLGVPVYEKLGFINYGPVSLINFAKKAADK